MSYSTIMNCKQYQHVKFFSEGAFNATVSYLKLFQGSTEDEMTKNQIEKEAERCVMLSIRVAKVINF